MNDPNPLPLLADNGDLAQHAPAPGHAEGETAHGTAEQDPFATLLGKLGDHREVEVGPWFHFELPVILVDDGLHLYSGVTSMEQGGLYTMDEHGHHIVGRDGAPPALDLSVTSLVFFQWLAMGLLFLILLPMARKYRQRGARPLSGFHNAIESVIVYVRDQVVLPNTGPDGIRLMPIFLTFFFFILLMNLIGLVPFGHAATGSLNVTAGLAIIAFFVIQGATIWKIGFGGWLSHLTGGVHWSLWPIMIPVEILGLFTKPFALCVRLFANMTAGHVILLSLIGLSFVTTLFIPVTLGFSLFINILELLVAFIQAYIFTILTAVFAGMGMASHDDHGHGHDQVHGEGLEHAAAH